AHRLVARLSGTAPTAVGIRVRVRLFAVQRELAGTREVALELDEGADVEAAWSALAARYPVLAPGRPSMRFARNGAHAGPRAGPVRASLARASTRPPEGFSARGRRWRGARLYRGVARAARVSSRSGK